MAICARCGQENPGDARFCNACAALLGTDVPAREQRKTVTVLFCDVTGSTALGESTDPEAVRALLGRYFARMKRIVERHGGTVEKFIGDAVMGVFGVPRVHEDDALRACRAAVEMREALPELGIRARIGLNTGEVVTGTAERLATGDAVNVAARLEQTAAAGEILIGESTRALVEDVVEAEAVEPLDLKGKAAPVAAFRLVSVAAETTRRHELHLVGRNRELTLIRSAYDQCIRDRACRLFTVTGAAGVGKSRLALEFLNDLETPTVVRGRCLSYGEGITYWPVVEVLKQLGTLPVDSAAASSLRSLLGESEEGTSAEEIAWSFRKLLEQQAPLVCVFDDIQWGEETFLDLVEHVALLSTGAPILLVCLARPELVERRPQWPVALELEPLSEPDVEELIPETFPDDLRAKIARASGGNPLFVIEMVAVSAAVEGEVRVPPTLRAVLAARLDQLESMERSVLERGAVEGEIFHRGAVQALSDDGQVTPSLASLVRRNLIQPVTAQVPGEDAFRFRHILIRDAAYDALPKATRAELHARFAAWLERNGANLVELDELLGRHLERSARYKAELGQTDAGLSEEAGTRLAAAGRRALLRGDDRAAARLLEDACGLIANETPVGVQSRIELGRALAGAGQLERAADAFGEAQQLASTDARLALRAELLRANLRSQTDAETSMSELVAVAERAMPVFADQADDWGLARSWFLLHWARFRTARYADSIEAAEKMVKHARRAGDAREEVRGLGAIAMATLWGPTPVDGGLRRLDELVERARGARLMEAFSHRVRGGFFSMNGRFDEGREHCRRAAEIYDELGHPISAPGVVMELQRIERQAGRLDVAEHVLREALERLRALGDFGYIGWVAAQLARVLAERGNRREACELARYCRDELRRDHAIAQIASRIAEATARRAEGPAGEVEAIASEAVELAGATDSLDLQGDALIALADLDRTAGRRDEARERAARAIELYERKGDIVSAARERERFGALLEESSV
jgi:class 3 adenylate cyclase/tetratricopeptide (TPR) repeat protein